MNCGFRWVGFNFADLQNQNRDILNAISNCTSQAVAATNQAKYDNINVLKDVQMALASQISDVRSMEQNILGAQQEYQELKEWFDIVYARKEQKYRRLHSLGKLTDEGKDPYDELINLYNEAEIKRARIQELERLLSDSSN